MQDYLVVVIFVGVKNICLIFIGFVLINCSLKLAFLQKTFIDCILLNLSLATAPLNVCKCLFLSDTLHDFVPFEQFKNFKKYPWKSVTFIKVTG